MSNLVNLICIQPSIRSGLVGVKRNKTGKHMRNFIPVLSYGFSLSQVKVKTQCDIRKEEY